MDRTYILENSSLLTGVVLGFCLLTVLVIGSFLNVVIYRVPNKLSLTKENSFCPKCHHKLRWYENIPLISFIIQKGRCRECGEKISWQYPLVEIAALLSGVAVYLRYGFSYFSLSVIFLLLAFICIFVIDLKLLIIPDSINIFILIVSLISLFMKISSTNGELVIDYRDKLWSLAVSITLYFVIIVIERITKIEVMGGGDIKLIGAVGLFLGYQLTLLGIFLAAIFGLLIEVGKKVFNKRNLGQEIAFGPSLVLGFSCALFWGLDLVNWYLTLF